MSGVYLTRVRLEQYRSFKTLDIHLPDGPGVLVVHGSNGIGKSSLFDGLEWVLTDRIDHFRDADGVKKAGNYLCRWRDEAPGPTTVAMDFSGENTISRTLSSSEASKSVTGGNIGNITEFLQDESWNRSISNLSSYLLLTHFLGQSSVSRLTNRDPAERFNILKEAAESKEIEDVANALHGKGNTKASRAYSGRIRLLNDEANALQSLLDAEANLWSGLTGIGALDDEAALQLAQTISKLLDGEPGNNPPAPVAVFDPGTIGYLDDRLTEWRGRIRILKATADEARSALSAWDEASRRVLEHEAASATAESQVKLLTTQRDETEKFLESAKSMEINAVAFAKNAREGLAPLIGLRDALRVVETTKARKEVADTAVTAALTAIDRENAVVASLERRLQIVRRIESEVGRLDERGKLAQEEQQKVRLWLARDARIVELRSSIQALQLRYPSLDTDIEHAERTTKDSEELLSGQKDILVELQKSVSAMSSAVARVAANLPKDSCDCPVCATHFDEEGELYRRAATAAERLAPLVLEQEGRVQSAVQRSELANNRLEELRQAKRSLISINQECESEEQVNKELSVGVFGREYIDREMVEARHKQLAESAETMARLRQRKWYWRNRLTGDFFKPGGEHAAAVRRRDQAQVQLNTSTQAQISLASELETNNALVSRLDEVVGGLRGAELEDVIRQKQQEVGSAETAAEQAAAVRQAIEQQLSLHDIAAASARARQQEEAGQVGAAIREKEKTAEVWQKLNFTESKEPNVEALDEWITALNETGEKLREAEDFLKQLREGRSAKALVDNHLASLERLRLAVTGAPNSDRLQLRREAEESVAAKLKLAQATREAKDIAQAASAEILDELAEFNTSYMQPLDLLMKSINRAILCDPRVGIEFNVKNRRIEQSATKEGEVPTRIGSLDPILVHSEGQMAALSVSMLCAASLTYPWSRWRGLVLDDPLQHNDAIHAAAFADFLCNLVADRQYQVLLSTHDRAQAEFLRRKVASRNLPCAVLSLLGTGQEGVEWSYRPADSSMSVMASA